MKKLTIFLLLLIVIPFVYAEEEDEDDNGWITGIIEAIKKLTEAVVSGIANAVGSLPDKIIDLIIKLVNLPLQPLLFLIKKLLKDEVNIDLLKSFWSIIVYMISMLYGLLFIFSGLNFMMSGYDVVKRQRAKEWLQNTIVMIILVQASFLLYKLLLSLTTTMTTAMINMIDESFFLFTSGSPINVALQIFLGFMYVIILLITVIILTVRYLLVAFGVVALPLGIFLYFFPPTKNYGKLVINFIIISAVIPFVDALILLMSSQVLDVGTFSDFKIVLMISSFFLVIIANLMMFSFIISNSSKVLPRGSTKLLTIPIMKK